MGMGMGMGMGFCNDKSPIMVTFVIPRWIKAVFFLLVMLLSLLVFSAPILLVIADALLPSAFLTVTLPPAPLSSHFTNYDFRRSLIDVPLVSIARSAVIFCVYSLCDGPRLSRWPYLATTAVCSVASLAFVSLKASYVFLIGGGGYVRSAGGCYIRVMETAMFVSSIGLGIGHVLVAYRTSCRERRKLLVYKIDIEAVTAFKKGFPMHHKTLQVARTK